MKADNRKSKRKPVHYPAWIELESGDLDKCQLSDVSDSGARLVVAAPDKLPETFTLRLSRLGKTKRICRVIWRSDEEAGIEFDKTRPAKGKKG
jgi:hypothetical protein